MIFHDYYLLNFLYRTMIQDYIQSIQSQLRNYSSGLRQMNNLVDIPWTMVDGDLNIQRLIFQRNHTLLIIKEGVIQESRWEYLHPLNSLILNIGGKRIAMNEVFVDESALILKKDGGSSEFFSFANETKLPSLNLVEYLKKKTKVIIVSPNSVTGKNEAKPGDLLFAIILVIFAIIMILMAK